MAEQQTRLISDESLNAIHKWMKRYPPERKQSAVMEALRIVQEQNGGWLTNELMDEVAEVLEMPKVSVYEVATFYTMYDLKKTGRHKIFLCTNVSCMLCGSEKIADYIKSKLGIDFGQTTYDGKFTLYEVECLAACGGAPAMILDKDYHENLTPEKIDNLIEKTE